MDTEEIKALDDRYIVHTYARAPFVIDRGEGVRVWDTDGHEYLDFVSGIAVNALGHGHPAVQRAIAEQASRLMHVSNLYYTEPQARLAQMLVESCFADKVYFCNSGAESVEAAIKFSRKYARTQGAADRTEFITFSGGFHGRTIGALALTPRDHYQDPFRPLMPGALVATYNDLASAEALMSERTCAVIVEPLQGEGGVFPADPDFLRGLRVLCDRTGTLLIFDEVQCGLGRTGTLWAHEFYGVTPDIMTIAKPIGGGLPMGVTLMTSRVADCLAPGDHGSTFAANPVICAAAQAVLKTVRAPGFLEHVRWAGSYLDEGLSDLRAKHPCIQEIRGRGLIYGLAVDRPVAPLVQAGYRLGMLTLNAGPQVLRLLPPLVVEKADLDAALDILDRAFDQVTRA